MRRLEAVPSVYRPHLAPLSLTPHPFGISDSAPQTSTHRSRLHTAMDALAAFAGRHQWPSPDGALKKLRKRAPALVALVDFWWAGSSWMWTKRLSPSVEEVDSRVLAALVYWEHQVAHTRCACRKVKRRQPLEAMHVAFSHHAVTQRPPPHALQEWQA